MMKILRIISYGTILLYSLLLVILRLLWTSLITLAEFIHYDDNDENDQTPDTVHFNYHSGVNDPTQRHDGHYK